MKGLSLLILFLMVMVIIDVSGNGTVNTVDAIATEYNIPKVIDDGFEISSINENSIIYKNSKGDSAIVIDGDKRFYTDDDGNFKKIDFTVEKKRIPITHNYEVTKGKYKAYFTENMDSKNAIKIDYKGDNIGYNIKNLIASDLTNTINLDSENVISSSNLDSKINFNDIFDNANLEIEYTETGTKEKLTLTALPQIDESYNYVGYSGEINIPVGFEMDEINYSISKAQIKEGGVSIFSLEIPIVFGERTHDQCLYKIIKNNPTNYHYQVLCNKTFIQNTIKEEGQVIIDPDLTVDGVSSIAYIGHQAWTNVDVINGATLNIGNATNYTARFYVTNRFYLDSTSIINGFNRGHNAGENNSCGFGAGKTSGASGSGGGNANKGGNSAHSDLGGDAGGNATNLGLCEGAGGGAGGTQKAGTSILIEAFEVKLEGVVNMSAGGYVDDAGASDGVGGASAGEIKINASITNISASTFNLKGGKAQGTTNINFCSGGGGSGGRVMIFTDLETMDNSSFQYLLNGGGIGSQGGNCGGTPQSGQPGFIKYFDIANWTLNTEPTVPSFSSPSNNSAFKSTILLEWINSTDTEQPAIIIYHLEIDNNEDFSSPTLILDNISEGITNTNYTFNATSQSKYFWRLKAMDNDSVYQLNSSLTGYRQFYYDIKPPSVEVFAPLSTTNQTNNLTNILINVSISESLSLLDNCKYNVYNLNGVALTNLSFSSSCGNAQINLTVAGIYNLTISANDTANNINNSISFKWVADEQAPNVTVTSPSGTVTSRTGITINATVVDDLELRSCWYNVTTSTGTLEGNKFNSMTCNSASTFNVSADGDYIAYAFANDTTGNFKSGSSSFTVDTAVSPGGSTSSSGGGGGTPEKKQDTNRTFDISVSPIFKNLKDTNRIGADGVVIKESLYLYNNGFEKNRFRLTCEEGNIKICEKVKLSTVNIDVFPSSTPTEIEYELEIPEGFSFGDAISFLIVATDSGGLQDSVTIDISIVPFINKFLNGIINLLSGTTQFKILKTNIPLPNLVILIFFEIISIFGITKIIKKGTRGRSFIVISTFIFIGILTNFLIGLI